MYQSPETTYTVIYMHDVVADFYLVELFQGKSQFPRTRMLAFQSVFVKPIEYLVVGETTYFQIVVDEPSCKVSIPV